ncbi:Fc.00g093940.m01.CDS01 [Cosmosporella sp. VM-42]
MARKFTPPSVPRPMARGMVFFLSAGLFVWLVSFTFLSGEKPTFIAPPLLEATYSDARQDLTSRERRFAVIVPANNPSPDLCKLITSAIALGYPSPVLVNWEKDFSDTAGGIWGPYLGKITGTLEYLDLITRLDTNKGDRLDNGDLVLIIDAYDVWFQLPPDMLLRRYHRSIKQANDRLAKQWPGDAERMPMKQTIMVSSQKRCYPTIKSGTDLHCDKLPESDLREDLYGAETDIEGDYYHNIRPRFLNSGSFMGPIGDMRRYFRRVKERMYRQIANDLPFDGDQGVFGEIFGEQEAWRTWRREQKSGISFNDTRQELPNQDGVVLSQREFEFHVGLDYTQNLFLPTVYEERDGDFVTLSNHSMIETSSSRLGISPARLNGVPEDLAETRNPLADILPSQFNRTTNWEEMPLYADFFTTAIPVVLHHNAWKNGVKDRRILWWDRTWYFPYLRTMLEAQLKVSKLNPLARVTTRDGEVTYFSPRSDSNKRKPRVFEIAKAGKGLDEVDFDTICRYPDDNANSSKNWYDELFRDGRGSI